MEPSSRTAPIYLVRSGEPTIATRQLQVGEAMPPGYGFTRDAMRVGWPSLCDRCDRLTDPETDQCLVHGARRSAHV